MLLELIHSVMVAFINLVVFTVIDILMLNRIFFPASEDGYTRIWELITWYHICRFWVLTPYIAVLSWLLVSWLAGVLTAIWMWLGYEDLLFCLLKYGYVPERFDWLPFKPTWEFLLVRTTWATVVVFFIYFLL